jgi:hypothetical protein
VPPERPSRRIDRSQLPDEFTPETVRAMGMRTARLLARHNNGVLTEPEQAAFDRALREVMQGSTDRLGRTVGRTRQARPPDFDPDLRRSYVRTQRRLDAQAARARQVFPQLTEGWRVDDGEASAPPATDADEDPAAEPIDDPDRVEVDEDVSVGTFETEIEQTSDTLEILERIATIQQQQLEHQRSQLLSETRGVFFALAVSVSVIVAGIAPLVEASPDKRRLILVCTAVVCALAGLGYAAVRAVQSRSD